MTCSFCGDPATGLCKRIHLDWTIVLHCEIEKGDLLMRPDGSMHLVSKVKRLAAIDGDPSGDSFVVETAQKKRFLIPYPTIPVLVKRNVICGWPRCEFHCGKCIRMQQYEEDRERYLQTATAVNQQAAKESEIERHHKKSEKGGAPEKTPHSQRKGKFY